jgi:hypothetical protein
LDAITPIIKERIGFRVKYVLPMVLCMLGSQLWILLVTSMDVKGDKFYNRSLGRPNYFFWTSSEQKPVEIHTGEFLTSRFVTILFWNLRITWKIYAAGQDDLLILLGNVWYHNYLVNEPSRRSRSGRRLFERHKVGRISMVSPLPEPPRKK